MKPGSKSVSIQVQRQLKSEWCWAAVSNSIEHFFDSASDLTQCRVASRELHEKCCGDLSAAKNSCNRPATLHGPLGLLGWLAAEPLVDQISFEAVQKEIEEGRPIGVLIKWLEPDGTLIRGHFIMITGYEVTRSGAKFLSIGDPLFPESKIAYKEFCDPKGGYHDGEGVWFATFLTRSSRKQD